jgi:hypothetical protein
MLQLESALAVKRQVKGGETKGCGKNEKPYFAKCECELVAASLRKRISCIMGVNQAKEAQTRFSNWVEKSSPENP